MTVRPLPTSAPAVQGVAASGVHAFPDALASRLGAFRPGGAPSRCADLLVAMRAPRESV
jgi:hypothetical protein